MRTRKEIDDEILQYAKTGIAKEMTPVVILEVLLDIRDLLTPKAQVINAEDVGPTHPKCIHEWRIINTGPPRCWICGELGVLTH